MKKFITYLAFLGIATFAFSCSSDDNTTVDPPQPPPIVKPEEKKLVLTANIYEAYIGDEIIFTANVGEDKIDDVIIKHIDGKEIENNLWTPTEKGEFKFIATKENYISSEPITIKVDEDVMPTGEGTFTHNETTYKIDTGQILFEGFFDLDEDDENSPKMTAWRLQYADLTTNHTVYIMFYTPAKHLGDSNYEYVLPTTKNIESTNIMIAYTESENSVIIKDFITANISIELKIGEALRKEVYYADIKVNTPANSSQAFELNYKGEHYFPQEE